MDQLGSIGCALAVWPNCLCDDICALESIGCMVQLVVHQLHIGCMTTSLHLNIDESVPITIDTNWL